MTQKVNSKKMIFNLNAQKKFNEDLLKDSNLTLESPIFSKKDIRKKKNLNNENTR